MLLVLIVYHLSKAMQAFGILHGDLIGQQATEATAGSPIVTAPLSPQADPFLPYVQQPISLENTDQERPNEATDQSVIEEVTPQFIASIQAVSYTHLDVYKRQESNSLTGLSGALLMGVHWTDTSPQSSASTLTRNRSSPEHRIISSAVS